MVTLLFAKLCCHCSESFSLWQTNTNTNVVFSFVILLQLPVHSKSFSIDHRTTETSSVCLVLKAQVRTEKVDFYPPT